MRNIRIYISIYRLSFKNSILYFVTFFVEICCFFTEIILKEIFSGLLLFNKISLNKL